MLFISFDVLNMNMDFASKYPWLRVNTTLEDYVRPDYYDVLIKDYSAQKVSDLDMLESFVKSIQTPNPKILELGFGTGRCTDVIMRNLPDSDITLVDLSGPMVGNGRVKYPGVNIVQSDSLSFLENCQERYDAFITLWSFSHSVHQHVDKMGFEGAASYVRNVLAKFIEKNLNPGGKVFIIHFDTLSDEQRILTKQWVRDFKKFEKYHENQEQSPSKQILDGAFAGLQSDGMIRGRVEHYVGDAIEYGSLDNAMEVFMNFHLESHFNIGHPKMEEVVSDLEVELSRYVSEDGQAIHVKPGFFIYEFTKVWDS